MSSHSDVSTTAVGSDLFSTRPFSAADATGGELLTVLVHFGRHLDALVPTDTQNELATTSAGDALNSYVVASVGAFAASPNVVKCCRGSDVKVQNLLAPLPSDQEGRVLYEQKCSPYAVTRVVEGSTSPSWNEMLAVPLPAGWPGASSTELHTPDQAADIKPSACLALKLELVERGASHQEDFLLATCVLPLASVACQVQQKRFALEFPASPTSQALPASIYISLQASSRNQVSNANALEQVEVTVESFTPVVVTGSEEDGMPLDCTSLAALIGICVDRSNTFPPEPAENARTIEDHFTLLRNGDASPDPSSVVGLQQFGQHAALSPSSSSVTGSASGVYEWLFPFSFALPPKSDHAAPFEAIDIALFKTSSAPNKLVGRGHLELSSVTGQTVKRDGLPLRHTVIPINLVGDGSRVFGHIALRLRWWDTAAWSAFVAAIPDRRVICTNRWKRSPRLTLAWLGALLRGLNRHPVTSICDAGGVSSVLADLLAESSPNEEAKERPQREQYQQLQNSVSHLNFVETTETSALLREQLAHLQAEGTSQRVQIERLQNELDTRLAAIKTCGLEIVTLRREARQKAEQLQKLKEQVDAAQRREQQQLEELLDSTNGNTAFPTRPDQKAASQRFALLAAKYKELDQEYQSVKQQVADSQRTIASYADLEERHAKLQEAHLVQAALIQRLQRDKQHAAALKKAVRMQERVIRQFEQTVAQQSAEAPERSPPRPLAPHSEHDGNDDSSGSETREALLRVRVQVLEQQLQTNARAAAAEMSALRMRILELEAAESRRTGK